MKAHLKHHVLETCFNGMSFKIVREIIEWNVIHCINESDGALRNRWAPAWSGLWGPPVLVPLMFAELI